MGILAFVIIYIFSQQKGLCIFNWKEVSDYESVIFADDTKCDSYTVNNNTIDNSNTDRYGSVSKADSQMRISTKQNDIGKMKKDDKSQIENKSLDKDTTPFKEVNILQDVASAHNVTNLESIINNNSHLVHEWDDSQMRKSTKQNDTGSINCVKLLVEIGKADVNSRGGPFLTDENKKQVLSGGSLLWVAFSYGQLEDDHPVISYLKSVGAKMILPPELSRSTKVDNEL